MRDWLLKFTAEFWDVLGDMAPYLLFGFLMAGVLSVYMSQRFVERHLGGKGFWPVLKASLFGIPLPLCSCGVIPVSASLRKQGASKGAVTSFLISTPQTGVDSILVTLALLGPVYAIFRPVASFIKGIIGGMAVSIFDPEDKPSKTPSEECTDSCCSTNNNNEKGNILGRIFIYAFITLPRDLGKGLLIGLIIAGLITVVFKPHQFDAILGGGILSMLIMMLIGIPVYVCATASVPIAAALIAAGVSPGAALVFLLTGPATNAATIGTVWQVMGKRTAVIYLASVAITALASGLILDYIFTMQGVEVTQWMPKMLPSWFESASAIILLAVLAYALFKPPTKGEVKVEGKEITRKRKLKIAGMDCSHCAQSVTKALLALPGVGSVQVNLKTKVATIGGSEFDNPAIYRAIDDAGFKVECDDHESDNCKCE